MNYQELEGMHILAEQLGLEFRYDDMLWPRLDGSQGAFKYQLPLREMIGLDKRDPERRQGWEKMAELSRDSLFRNEFVYSCGAGLRSFHVDCAGKMSICDMSRRHVYDLLQMSFQQAWEQMGSLREMRRQLDTPCQTCKAGGLCTQCPGWSQAIHGDDETPVELVCTLGRRRAEQFQYTS
jgi:radical SAM protein with 4Fe4S-binding SPASM domain